MKVPTLEIGLSPVLNYHLMEETLFRCTACGKGLRTSQALAGHRRFCPAQKSPKKEEGLSEEVLQDMRELNETLTEMETRLARIESRLAKMVEFHTVPQGIEGGLHKLYFIPEGYRTSSEQRPVTELRYEIKILEGKLDLLKEQIAQDQRKLKGWLIQVLKQAGLYNPLTDI